MRSHLSTRLLSETPGPSTDLLTAALEAGGATDGGGHTTSVVVVVPVSFDPTAISELGESAWHRSVDVPLQTTLALLQEARQLLVANGGAIVVVVPTIGVAGAATLVPITTVVEGARAMTKSAARQWADDGIAVNLLGLPLQAISPDLSAQTDHLLPPAGDSVTASDVGRALEALLTATPAMTGATLVVDGGQVMVP